MLYVCVCTYTHTHLYQKPYIYICSHCICNLGYHFLPSGPFEVLIKTVNDMPMLRTMPFCSAHKNV